MAKRSTGVVRWFDGSKGYGYIDAEDGEGVFVHYTDISGEGPPLLIEGDHVAFLINIPWSEALRRSMSSA